MLLVFTDEKDKKCSLQEICNLILKIHKCEIFIGSDSQIHRKKRKVKYVTCIVIYRKGKGGKIFKCIDWEDLPSYCKIENRNERKKFSLTLLKKRLTNEVWRTVQTGLDLQSLLSSDINIVMDVDLNKDLKHRSSNYFQELTGMVQGSGFQCRSKPDSWAATCVADRFSK